MSKPKVLFISDSPRLHFIGQSKVTRESMNRLMNDYEVECLGFADAEVPDPINVPYKVIPCLRTDMLDVRKTVELINQSNPQVVIFSHDPWLFPSIPYVRSALPHIKYLGWLTIDGEPAFHGWSTWMRAYDKIISPSEFGAKTLLDRWCDLNISVVPYGLNHNIFHTPKQGKTTLKTQLTQDSGGQIYLHDKFVATFIGANQDRKNLAMLHQAWRAFEADKPDYSICLLMLTHSASLKENVGHYDLVSFIHDTKTIGLIDKPQPDQTIGHLVAASDIAPNFGNGGGFELTIAEAMACGTVPIVLNYAGISDYCTPDNCYEVPYIKHPGGYHVGRAVCSEEDALAKLNEAYEDWKTGAIQHKALEGIKSVQKYTWENTAELLKQNIDEVLSYSRDKIYLTRLV